MDVKAISVALNRVADALYDIARSEAVIAAEQKKAVGLQSEIVNMQRVHMAVSQALEQELLTQRANDAGPAN